MTEWGERGRGWRRGERQTDRQRQRDRPRETEREMPVPATEGRGSSSVMIHVS